MESCKNEDLLQNLDGKNDILSLQSERVFIWHIMIIKGKVALLKG